MPKKKKYPKQPRANSSQQTWDRYFAKCKEVASWNKTHVLDPKEKKQKIKNQVSRLKAGLPLTGK